MNLRIYLGYFAVPVCLILVSVLGADRSENGLPDICLMPHRFGVCYLLYSAWYYDAKKEECVEFVFGGCGGNENRFPTEEECYKTCKEKLVWLHPPRNITVAYATKSEIYIVWYKPMNFKLHDPSEQPDNISDTKPLISGPGFGSSIGATVVNNSTGSLSPGNSSSQTADNTTVAYTNSSREVTSFNGTGEETVVGAEIEDYVGKDRVPFHMANLTHYLVSYRKSEAAEWTNVTVKSTLRDYNITNLTAATLYEIRVSAVYLTNTTMPGNIIKNMTRAPDIAATRCYCDHHGTVGGVRRCNMTLTSLPYCPCKDGYAGLFCEICANSYYRTGVILPCQRCPCTKISSSGSCHFVEGYLHCTVCKEGYAGNLCHRCGNGYYRDRTKDMVTCIKCKSCQIKPGPICNPYTGECLNCAYNTTGHKCDTCLPGYVGDPVKNISCVLESEQSASNLPSKGVIAAVCVGTIVLISGIVGVIIYRRMRNLPPHRPFWTVELKEDHEGVDFSSVPDDEMYPDDRNVEDLDFYGRSIRGGGQSYSKLKEEF